RVVRRDIGAVPEAGVVVRIGKRPRAVSKASPMRLMGAQRAVAIPVAAPVRLRIVMKNAPTKGHRTAATAKGHGAATKTLRLPRGRRQDNDSDYREYNSRPIDEVPHDVPPELTEGRILEHSLNRFSLVRK